MPEWLSAWREEIKSISQHSKPSDSEMKLLKKHGLSLQVLDELGVGVNKVEQVRKAFKLSTQNGLVALKETSMDYDRLVFITEASAYLHRQGFHKVLEYIPLANGKYFLPSKKSNYLFSRWVSGTECDMTNARHVYQAAVTMAELHHYSRNFKPSVSLKKISRLGYLPEDMSLWASELKKITDWLTTGSGNRKLRKFLPDDHHFFVTKASHALSLLEQFNYHRFVKHADDLKALLHQDFIYHNLIWVKDTIYLIDLDYLTYDLRCIDLAKFLRRMLIESNWDFKISENILAGYTSILKLTSKEYRLMHILLTFPYKYWQILHICFFEKKSRSSKSIRKQLGRLWSQRHNKEKFLERFGEKYC